MSSSAHASTRNDALDLDDAATWTARSFDALENYAQTKLMNALFARELPRRYPGLVAVPRRAEISPTHRGAAAERGYYAETSRGDAAGAA